MKIQERFDDLPLPGFVKDIIFVIVVVGAISLLSQLVLGLWTPMVAVESGSMVPNLNIGDIIIVQGASRTDVVPSDVAEKMGYSAFNRAGDVILYRPYGKESLNILDQLKMLLGMAPGQDKATPIIHRALRYVEPGVPMWEGGPAAPFSGYITKGDHNDVIDQMAGQVFGRANLSYIETHRDEIMNVGNDVFLDKKTGLVIYKTDNGTFVGQGISYLTPVKEEWVIGVARAKIPLIGYVRLLPNIILDEVHKLIGS
ncbi:MAG: S26 family signal peptidase [Methanothrix sp.]|nr:S26 family signal peptidase [Methanothrix sp.]